MPQDWTDDVFAGGHAGQTDLANMEKNFQCLKTCFSGTSAPSNPSAGMWWLDTTNHLLKQRNEANNGWINVWDVANGRPADGVVTIDSCAAALKSPAAGTEGLRKLGTGATEACAGNDSRLSDTRTPTDGSVTQAKMAYAAGDCLIIANDAEVDHSTPYQTWTKVKETRVVRNGTLRVKFDFRDSFNAGNDFCKARVYRNGSPVGTERSSTCAYVTYSEDIAGWESGDLCQLYVYSYDMSRHALVKNFRLYGEFYQEEENTLT